MVMSSLSSVMYSTGIVVYGVIILHHRAASE